jgi:hypothetical protein
MSSQEAAIKGMRNAGSMQKMHDLLDQGAKSIIIMSGNLMRLDGNWKNPHGSVMDVFRDAMQVTLCQGTQRRLLCSKYSDDSSEEESTEISPTLRIHRRNQIFGLGVQPQPFRQAVNSLENLMPSSGFSAASISLANTISAADVSLLVPQSPESPENSDDLLSSENATDDDSRLNPKIPTSLSFSSFQHLASSPPECFVPLFPSLNQSEPARDATDTSMLPPSDVWLVHHPGVETIEEQERHNVKITCKFFFPLAKFLSLYQQNLAGETENFSRCCALDCFLTTAIQSLCRAIKTTYLDSLVLALDTSDLDVNALDFLYKATDQRSTERDIVYVDCLVKVWEVLQKLRAEGLVKNLGVADLELPQLKVFLQRVDTLYGGKGEGLPPPSYFYPFTNQIVPVVDHSLLSISHDQFPDSLNELLEGCKAHGISLTTHRDPKSPKVCQKFTEKLFDALACPNNMGLAWCFRYSYFIPSRSVMSYMAYMSAFS